MTILVTPSKMSPRLCGASLIVLFAHILCMTLPLHAHEQREIADSGSDSRPNAAESPTALDAVRVAEPKVDGHCAIEWVRVPTELSGKLPLDVASTTVHRVVAGADHRLRVGRDPPGVSRLGGAQALLQVFRM
jgi:hypothetical protein